MLLVEYEIRHNKPIIYEIGRKENGEKYRNTITDFEPYFYVLTENKHLFDNDNRVKRIEDKIYKEIYGKEVVKVIVNNLYDIRELRNLVEQSYEADVDYATKYTIDRCGELKKEPIATCFIDIEVNDAFNTNFKGFPKPREAKLPITAITCYNTLSKRMITFCWKKGIVRENKEEIKRLEKEGIEYTDKTIYYKGERELLIDFLSYINDTDPDVFSCWNAGFDMGYIIQRLYNIALDYNKLSPFGIVIKQENRINKDKDDITIKGRVILDLLTAYKNLNFKGLESFKLDNVAEKEVGEKKVTFDGTLEDLYNDDFDRFIDYNKKDVELLIRIDAKRKIIDIFDEIRRLSKCSFSNMFKIDEYVSTQVTDAFILNYCYSQNIVLQTKGYHSKENFAGATVLTPIKGLHKYLSVFDFQGLYMKIAQSLNCSPETLTTISTSDTVNLNIPYLDSVDIENNISVKSHRKKLTDEFAKFTEENWNIKDQTFDCNIPDKFLQYFKYKKIHYTQDSVGVLPGLIDYLFTKRNEMKKTRDRYEYGTEEYDFYERKQYGFKIIMNTIYGCIGYSGFRLYTPEIAASITYIGRNAILWSKRIVEDMEMLK